MLETLPHDTLILDGEATGGWGRQGQADYNVFDVLWLDGRDLRPLPLDERRAILEDAAVHAAGGPRRRRSPATRRGSAPAARAGRA